MADFRYKDANGVVWPSKLEARVAQWMDKEGIEYDSQPRTFSYTSRRTGARCLDCSSDKIVQDRTYTPDFLPLGWREYLEVKGFLRPEKRVLLQTFIEERRDVPLCFIFQSNKTFKPGLKRTPKYLDWAEYYGCRAIVWSDKRGLTELL